MNSTSHTHESRHQRQAENAVLIILMFAFIGSMVGLTFGVALGGMDTLEAWVVGCGAVVTGGLLILFKMRRAMATGVITASLSIFLVFYLNAGAILAYTASPDISRIVPYICWFYPLVLIHQFTNMGYYKRPIGFLLNIGPTPVALFVLAHLVNTQAYEYIGVIATFLISFVAFNLFVYFITRHRDEATLRAAKAEESERSAAMLRLNEERFRLLTLATNDLIWDADLMAKTIWWNDTLLDSYGYDPSEFANDMTAWESWIHPDDRARAIEGLEAVQADGGSNWSSEYRMICGDGRTVDVIDRGIIIRDSMGKPVRALGSTTDVTELRILQKKLNQSQKMEAIGQMTGGIAHDFNNLLTVIVGSAEILQDLVADNPKAQELAEMTIQAAERGANLTSRLLSFARLQTLAPKRIHLERLLTGLEELIRRTITEDIGIDIRIADADIGLWIEADPGQLENAILNLVINARDAMPEGGLLMIEASNVSITEDEQLDDEGIKAGDYVMIAVSDTGSGMPPHVSERAFEPFFTTKEVGKGSGLGLSMVWGFVKQSDGYAQIHSARGEGTSVKLYFPVANNGEMQEMTQKSDVSMVGGTERILVVEDDHKVRESVVIHLGNLGYTVRQAASADEALVIMDDDATFDLLFTDVVMPGGKNGRQLADAALIRQPEMKVLFTSGYTEDAILHQGRLEPGVNLLNKPYRRGDLAAKVREVLSPALTDQRSIPTHLGIKPDVV